MNFAILIINGIAVTIQIYLITIENLKFKKNLLTFLTQSSKKVVNILQKNKHHMINWLKQILSC